MKKFLWLILALPIAAHAQFSGSGFPTIPCNASVVSNTYTDSSTGLNYVCRSIPSMSGYFWTTPNGQLVLVNSAPTGSCTAGLPNQQVISTGTQYSCQNVTAGVGTWAALGGGGSSITGVVTPETSGAKGDGVVLFDGSIGVTYSSSSATGTGTTATAPTATTTVNNTTVLSVFLPEATWSVNPSPGTIRVNDAFSSNTYGFALTEQNIPTPTTTTAVAGTQSSSVQWVAITMQFLNIGSSLTFVNRSPAAQRSTAGTVATNVPTGTVNGNLMVGCAGYFNTANTFTPPTGWTQIATKAGADTSTLVCYERIASSEPASYNWTTSNGGVSAFIVAYSGALTTTLNSPSATFAAGDAGKLLCVEKTSSSAGQTCGTISAFVDAHDVTTSFTAASGVTSAMFDYGTNDYTAFNTMLSSAPCSTIGCQVQLSTKRYVLNNTLSIPGGVPISILGTGAAVPITPINFISGQTPVQTNNGSVLLFLSTTMSNAAIQISGTTGVVSRNVNDVLQDFGMYGGAGSARDGGGADAIDVINWQNFSLERVTLGNFAGIGFFTDGINASTDYVTKINVDQLYAFFNNLANVKIGSTTAVLDLETINLTNCELEGSGGPAVWLAGSNIQAFRVQGCVIQWNNITTADYEIKVSGTAAGGEISGNYFEIDSNLGSQSNSPDIMTPHAAGSVGIHWGENFGIINAVSRPPRFTAAQLPSCIGGSTFPGSAAYVNRKLACVTDATACTIGTTLVGSGLTTCKVQCVGVDGSTGAWKESGTAEDCQ